MVDIFNGLWNIFIIPIYSLAEFDNVLVAPAFMLLLGWVFKFLYNILSVSRGK